MTTSDIIRQLYTRKNIILVEFCRHIDRPHRILIKN